ncbi:hypothetical protein H4S02_009573, partial [Coemansia sp. RSA 2611]
NAFPPAPARPAPVDAAVYATHRHAEATVRVGAHLFHRSQMSAADTWLAVLVAMHDTSRLRAHRVALALLAPRDAPSCAPLPADALDPLRALADATRDPLRAAAEFHRAQFVCLDAARSLQALFTVARLLGSSPKRMGIWAVFVLEHVVSVHCARLAAPLPPPTRLDALRRLALLLDHVLSLKHWTSALYVFAGVVKAFVDPHWLIADGPCVHVRDSPWPDNHVLTRLMHEMRIDARRFCAYLVPVVYASAMREEHMSAGVRMRVASLLS